MGSRLIPFIIILLLAVASLTRIGVANAEAVCPTRNVQHWDKIVFKVINRDLAQSFHLTPNTELDIKTQDDPTKVADVKQKVLNFLKAPYAPRDGIQIVNEDYAIICAMPTVSENTARANLAANIIKVPSASNATGSR
jgi:hypothetical protein